MHKPTLSKPIICWMILCLTPQYMQAQTTWIDVRTAAEFSTGHIDGAINIPHSIIAQTIHEKIPDKNADIKLYCRSGRRSALALSILQDLGYRHAVDFGAYHRADTDD